MVAVFVIGALWTEVKNLKTNNAPTNAAVEGQQADTVAGEKVQNPPAAKTADNVPPVTDEDHVKGKRNARIALIEYSDFECPFCKRFHPTAQQVVDEYDGKVMWVYRHFPLALHPNAQMEAEASECAAEQGGNNGFWKFGDTIFERTSANGASFTKEDLITLSGELGFDKEKFSGCLDSGKYTQAIKDEMDAGAVAGVEGTPGNILLDTKVGAARIIPGAVPYDQIKQVIDKMLEAS